METLFCSLRGTDVLLFGTLCAATQSPRSYPSFMRTL